jgi:hypothetical protein
VRAFRLLAMAVAAAAVAAPLALAAGEFPGSAQQLAPAAAEIGFKTLTASGATAKPPAGKRTGFRSGWQTTYLKGTAKKPVQALALVYVYRTAADAKGAYASSCSGCKGFSYQGIEMKYRLESGATPTLVNVATCRNVYAAVAVSGRQAANALSEEGGSIVGAVFRRALAQGMASCAGAA